MDLAQYSEICFGLIWEGRRLPSMFNADDFFPPFDEAVRILQTPGATKEDVAKVISPKFIQNAHNAVKGLNGLGDDSVFDTGLVKAANYYRLSRRFSKAASKMEKNEDVDLLPLYGELTSLVSNQSTGLTLVKDIDISNYSPFQDSGWDVFDLVVGNFPTDGSVVVYGSTGIGKSHWASNLIIKYLQRHSKKTGAVYTLEMSAEHWVSRETKMYPELSDVIKDRLYISGMVRSIEQLVAEVTSKRVDIVVLDDMDHMVSASSPEEYERVYRKVNELCRFMKIPVVVLAQPNRVAKLSGRFLEAYDVAWSGAAENSASLHIALQKASTFDIDPEDAKFPVSDDPHYYMIFWKSRDGWPKQHGPGAIILKPDSQMWRGRFYQDKKILWTPERGRQTVGKKSNR